MRRIVHAKGLAAAESFVGHILMPTPMAVLQAAQLIGIGTEKEQGLGDLVLVDVGGATTDVHSIGTGLPRREGVIVKGLPEPHAKRTVEGDLGIRYNAGTIIDAVGKRALLAHAGLADDHPDVEHLVRELSSRTETVPSSDVEWAVDEGLARAATEVAVKRHAGTVETAYTPTGRLEIQRGKDLTEVPVLIGTGGIFAWAREPYRLLEAALFDASDPCSLRPKNPRVLVDAPYILYGVGLLAEQAPDKALRIAKKYLREVPK